jgi:hypothetical protein
MQKPPETRISRTGSWPAKGTPCIQGDCCCLSLNGATVCWNPPRRRSGQTSEIAQELLVAGGGALEGRLHDAMRLEAVRDNACRNALHDLLVDAVVADDATGAHLRAAQEATGIHRGFPRGPLPGSRASRPSKHQVRVPGTSAAYWTRAAGALPLLE